MSMKKLNYIFATSFMFLQFGVCDISSLNEVKETIKNTVDILESAPASDTESNYSEDTEILTDSDSCSDEILRTVDVEILGIKSYLKIHTLIPMHNQKAINMSLCIPEQDWNACESAAKTSRDEVLLYNTFIKPLLDNEIVKDELSKTNSSTQEYGSLSIETTKDSKDSLTFHMDFVLNQDLSLDHIYYYTKKDIEEEDRVSQEQVLAQSDSPNDSTETSNEHTQNKDSITENKSLKHSNPSESTESSESSLDSKKVK